MWNSGITCHFNRVVGLRCTATWKLPSPSMPVVMKAVEFRNHLPFHPRGRITLHRHVETPFSVDDPRDVVSDLLIWPSLLITCAHRVVTPDSHRHGADVFRRQRGIIQALLYFF